MMTPTPTAEAETARRLVRTGTGLYLLTGLVGLIPATEYGQFLPRLGGVSTDPVLVGLFGALVIATILGTWEHAVLPTLATLVLAATLTLNTGLVWPANIPQLFADLAAVTALVVVHAGAPAPVPRRIPRRNVPVRKVAIARPDPAQPRIRPADAPVGPTGHPLSRPQPAAPQRHHTGVDGNAALALLEGQRQAENLFLDDFAG